MFYGSSPHPKIIHNLVPFRLRLSVPTIRHKHTFAELLKQTLLQEPSSRGIYHVEPNALTGTLLVKYHPAQHAEVDVISLVTDALARIESGEIEITQKHRKPRLSRMQPSAFFTRELMVSIGGNVIAGLVLARFASK